MEQLQYLHVYEGRYLLKYREVFDKTDMFVKQLNRTFKFDNDRMDTARIREDYSYCITQHSNGNVVFVSNRRNRCTISMDTAMNCRCPKHNGSQLYGLGDVHIVYHRGQKFFVDYTNDLHTTLTRKEAVEEDVLYTPLKLRLLLIRKGLLNALREDDYNKLFASGNDIRLFYNSFGGSPGIFDVRKGTNNPEVDNLLFGSEHEFRLDWNSDNSTLGMEDNLVLFEVDSLSLKES